MRVMIEKFIQKNLWAILATLVFLLLWGARLEWKVNANEASTQKEGRAMQDIIEEDHDKLDMIRESQIRMEQDVIYIKQAIEDAPATHTHP